jgi:hypothetical protein
MTEKVVSLSGGLVLGMLFALFLGIGATQTMTLPVRFEYPAISRLSITQEISSAPAPARDTTPTISVAPPSVEQDRGRITRIATSTETSPFEVTAPVTATQEEILLKNWYVAETPKTGSNLQRANLQHSYIACNPTTSASIYLAQIAGSCNFTAIAEIASGNPGYTGQPSLIEGKPQTGDSPSIAHNSPGEGDIEGSPSEPTITGDTPSPKPTPDNCSEETDPSLSPRTPYGHYGIIENGEGHPELGNRPEGFNAGSSLSQPPRKLETD